MIGRSFDVYRKTPKYSDPTTKWCNYPTIGKVSFNCSLIWVYRLYTVCQDWSVLWFTVMILSWRSSLIWVYTVCHSVCIIWMHYSIVKPPRSNIMVITANFSGVQIFRSFTVMQKMLCLKFSYKYCKLINFCKWNSHAHPAKSQISLCICAVRSVLAVHTRSNESFRLSKDSGQSTVYAQGDLRLHWGICDFIGWR